MQVSASLAARILIGAVGLSLFANGLYGLVVDPSNSVDSYTIGMGVVISVLVVPRKYRLVAFASASGFAGLLVLATTAKMIISSPPVHDASHALPSRAYWGLIYLIPMIIWRARSRGIKHRR
jgi:hypothetical protein